MKHSLSILFVSVMQIQCALAYLGTPLVPSYRHLYQNLFKVSCSGCHQVDPALGMYGTATAGVDLSSYRAMMASNANPNEIRSHQAFLIPGNSANSRLFTSIRDGWMPKHEGSSSGRKIDPALIEELRVWIDQGARQN